MAMDYQTSEPIILGSGELYIGLASEIADLANLTTQEEEALVNIGAIESGASITIKTEKKEIKAANRGLIRKFVVDKEVRFSTGIMTWVMENVAKYLLGSTFTKDATTGQEKFVLNKNDDAPVVYLRFVHKKKTGGSLTVNIYKAQFDGDLSFTFDDEKPLTVDYEFVALADDSGNYVEFIETFTD